MNIIGFFFAFSSLSLEELCQDDLSSRPGVANRDAMRQTWRIAWLEVAH